MPSEAEIEKKLWKSIESDRTVMLELSLPDADDSQPMTAQFHGEPGEGPIWFFTAKDTELARALGEGSKARIQFVSKGHDLFASIHGHLAPANDPAMIDRLWNPFVAAWFEGGKSDPKLQLMRFDPARAHVWLNENSLFAGVKMLLGSDPKKDYADKSAELRL